jgi:oligoribonuclease NrnB/cAMP/cGMP phosphodiesterase (DHH superfamily)
MKCFYHSSDLDGRCSAAIVKRKHPDVELIPINYGQDFPWEDITKGEIVYMVDFSLQPFSEMLKLMDVVDLIWIDHHKTAIEESEKCGKKCKGVLKSGIGACLLVWNSLFPNDPAPEVVHLLAEYDVWNHSNKKCLPLQYGLRNTDNWPYNIIWQHVLDGEMLPELIKDGSTILRYEEKQNSIKSKSMCFETELDGLNVIAANQGLANSKFFDAMWDSQKYDAMLLFNWRKGQWNVSLYSDSVDVGKVAKNRGGGGHAGAAGFQCADLPFALV